LLDSQRSSCKSSARTRCGVEGIVKKYTSPLAINPQPSAVSSAPAPRSGRSFGRTHIAGSLFREFCASDQQQLAERSAALRQIMCRLTSRSDRVRSRYRRYLRELVCRQAVQDRMTRSHAAGFGKARLGHNDAALAMRRDTAARSCSAAPGGEGRAGCRGSRLCRDHAADCRGQEPGGVGVFRCAQDLGNRSALDNTAGIHDRARIGDLGSDPRS